jgi:hypothetical protein
MALSYWDAVRAAEEGKRAFTAEYPPHIPIEDIVRGSEPMRITGFAARELREQLELVEGAEEFQLFCEERGPRLPPATPAERAYAEAYMTAPHSLKGIRGYIETEFKVVPEDIERLTELLKKMLPKTDVAELMHAFEDYLSDMAREGVITPPWAKGGGGLMKLGYYAHNVISSYTAAPPEEGREAFAELLKWLAGVIWKDVRRPVAELTAVEVATIACREAVYAYPWLKLWLSQALANRWCDELSRGEATVGTMSTVVAEGIAAMGFLTVMALIAAEWSCPATVGGMSASEALAKICTYLGTLEPERRYMDIVSSCIASTIDRKCSYAASVFVAERPRLARLRGVIEEGCRAILGHIFSEPRALKDFVRRYIYGRSAVEVGDYYTALSAETGVPRYRVVLAVRALRRAEEIPYPWFIERALRGLG